MLFLGKTVTMQFNKNNANSFSELYVRLKLLLPGIMIIKWESNVSVIP